MIAPEPSAHGNLDITSTFPRWRTLFAQYLARQWIHVPRQFPVAFGQFSSVDATSNIMLMLGCGLSWLLVLVSPGLEMGVFLRVVL